MSGEESTKTKSVDKSSIKVRMKPNISEIKNKMRRKELFVVQKMEKNKLKRDTRLKRRKAEKQLGKESLPPKEAPKTIENTRVKDETIVDPEDEEVLMDQQTDEMSSYFKCERTPKILLTTSSRPKSYETVLFIKDLVELIPNSEYHERNKMDLKRIIPQAIEHGFTDIVIINEDRKMANSLLISHLPNGPTAHFKLSSIKRSKKIKNHGKATSHRPEVLLNNFNTRLGQSVGRLLAAIFPYDPQFVGRRCVTFHNQRDFIFFRHHRYIFKNSKKAGLQELGPRFTLKLRSLQRGTFDSKFGEYEWVHKRREMDTSRRKFHL